MILKRLIIVCAFNLLYEYTTGTEDDEASSAESETNNDVGHGGKLSHVIDTRVASSGHFIVEYFIDKRSYDTIIEYRLRSAMNKIEQASCLRFKKLSSVSDRTGHTSTLIRVTNPNNVRECSHDPYIDGEQNVVMLVLGLDCLQEREMLHSLLHAIGFNDEVTHPQRDQYVRVLWDNIQPKYLKLFRIKVNNNFGGNRVEYDPLSIMHFHVQAYSSNGNPTIIPVMPGLEIYPSSKLSTLDKMKLHVMFGQSCRRRKLSEVSDSCKTIMKSKKQNEDREDDEVSPETDGMDTAKQEKTHDDNMYSSGPEIMEG